MPLRWIYLLLLVTTASPLYAQSFDINVSDDSAQVKYGSLIGGSNYGRTELGFGFLYNEDDNYLAEISLQVVDEAGSKSPGLQIGVGPKLYGAHIDNHDADAIAVGLGGQLLYKPPSLPRLILSLAGYYAPGIITFQDADHMYEAEARVGYEILPTVNLYLGYRSIELDLDEGGNKKVDDGGLFGMMFRF